MKKKLLLFLTLAMLVGGIVAGTGVNLLAKKVKKQSIEVLNYNKKTEAIQLSILNGVGNIEVFHNSGNKVKMIATLEIESGSYAEQKIKREQLMITPKIKDGVLFVEAIAKENGMDYWTWLKKNLNTDKTKIHYKVYVPTNIKTVKIYNAVGNVITREVKSSLDIETYIGNIKGSALVPQNYVSTVVYTGNIQMDYKDISNVKLLQSVSSIGNITIKIPKKFQYTMQETKSYFAPLKIKNVFSDKNISKVRENLYTVKQYKGKKTTVSYFMGFGTLDCR